MGNQINKPYTGEKKTVIVVGGSFAGDLIIRHLVKLDPNGELLNIILVDKNEHFEFICSHYKVFTDEDAFENHCLSYDKVVESYRSSNVSFVQARLTSVEAEKNAVTLQGKDGTVKNFNYDALAICTGFSYSSPYRSKNEEMSSFEDRSNAFKAHRQKLKSSMNCLVVGGGPNGVEVAAYIKEAYPSKRVVLCEATSKLCESLPNAHLNLMKLLEEVGVEVLLETKYDDSMKDKWDYVINCVGQCTKGTTQFMKGGLEATRDKSTGKIMVNAHGQITNHHPLLAPSLGPQPHIVYTNIFAFGDCSVTRMDELKTIPSLYQYYQPVATNLMSVAMGGKATEEMPTRSTIFSVVSVGKSSGIMQFNGMSTVSSTAFDTKETIFEGYMGQLKNIDDKVDAESKKVSFLVGLFNFTKNDWFSFLPIHVSKKDDLILDITQKRIELFEEAALVDRRIAMEN